MGQVTAYATEFVNICVLQNNKDEGARESFWGPSSAQWKILPRTREELQKRTGPFKIPAKVICGVAALALCGAGTPGACIEQHHKTSATLKHGREEVW